jgi:hypothetical protein
MARNLHFRRVKGILMKFRRVHCSATKKYEYPESLQREIEEIPAAFAVDAGEIGQ